MIIDAHAHVFPQVRGHIAAGPTRGLGYGRMSVGADQVQLIPPLCEDTVHTPEMLLAAMDWAGVDRAMLLQGPMYGECNDYVARALRRHPDRLIGAAFINPWGSDCEKQLENVCGYRVFRAVKLEFSQPTGLYGTHLGARFDDSDLAWLWDELQNRQMVLVLDLGSPGSPSYQTSAIRAIAEGHPRLRVVICHLAQPSRAAEGEPALWRQWQEQIDLGLLRNVWFDTAAMPAYLSEEGYPYPSAERYIRMAVDRIGASRIMWGTDTPGLLTHATYPQLLKLAERHTWSLSEEDRSMILGETAAEVYGQPEE